MNLDLLPEYARDAYLEREAIMREANNIPDDQPTPPEILAICAQVAAEEMELVRKFLDSYLDVKKGNG